MEMDLGKWAAARQIPDAVAVVANADRELFSGVHGEVADNAIFAIASMTKAITTAAALQLVERGALHLDEPVGGELAGLPVLEGFDGNDAPRFSTARYSPTLRQLLNHTAGFAYPWNHALMKRYGAVDRPFLVHEPGTRWYYGVNVDWVGKLVEIASGQTLEAYFQEHIFQPLEMGDTTFLLPPEKLHRFAPYYQRESGGELERQPRVQPPIPAFFNGGGGLFSTARDYIRFTQMILRRGAGPDGTRILSEASVQAMSTNQVGKLDAGRIYTTMPTRSRDIDFHPGAHDQFGLGFLINPAPYKNGRSAGSLSWGGIRNTFYWIDPARGICAVLLMHFQPFCDAAAMGLLRDFEQAVYSQLL
jgi:CubicO group peptidase (beta-lactamase class C family)